MDTVCPSQFAARTTLYDVFFFQAEDGIRDYKVTGVQTCALPISAKRSPDRRKTGRRVTASLPTTTELPTIAMAAVSSRQARSGRAIGRARRRRPRSEERRVGEEGRSRGAPDP